MARSTEPISAENPLVIMYHLGEKAMYSLLTTSRMGYAAILGHPFNNNMQRGSKWIVATGPGDNMIGIVNYVKSAKFETIEEEATAFENLICMHSSENKKDNDLFHSMMKDFHEKIHNL